ncbi:S39AB protein, partial [Polyodon spathula]|nr:S39AB protein [Polyodon spathula]
MERRLEHSSSKTRSCQSIIFRLQIHSEATRPIVPEDNTDLVAPLQSHRRPISHRKGLTVGVGFAAAGKTLSASFESARNLAIGMGIQNFPEGLAVSLPFLGA